MEILLSKKSIERKHYIIGKRDQTKMLHIC